MSVARWLIAKKEINFERRDIIFGNSSIHTSLSMNKYLKV